jgi:large subunit ribosomal protein L32
MAVQKRRQSSARRDSRRAQWMARVAVPNVQRCPNCGEAKHSHRVCMSCGFYDGRQVIEVKKREEGETK